MLMFTLALHAAAFAAAFHAFAAVFADAIFHNVENRACLPLRRATPARRYASPTLSSIFAAAVKRHYSMFDAHFDAFADTSRFTPDFSRAAAAADYRHFARMRDARWLYDMAALGAAVFLFSRFMLMLFARIRAAAMRQRQEAGKRARGVRGARAEDYRLPFVFAAATPLTRRNTRYYAKMEIIFRLFDALCRVLLFTLDFFDFLRRRQARLMSPF